MFANLVLPSMLMGLGIAIDVLVATLSRFRDTSMTFRSWTLPVAVAHILLPAIGYYSWWALGATFSALTLPLGLVAFAIISLFLYEAFCEWTGRGPVITLKSVFGKWVPDGNSAKGSHLIAVLAVSMDALWSGPAKAAQAESGHWNGYFVAFSFVIAGAVVAIVAELALIASHQLNRVKFRDMKILAGFLLVAKYIEITVLFGFGILSLWNALHSWIGLGTLGVSTLVSGSLMLLLWIASWRRLYAVQIEELEDTESATIEKKAPVR